MPGYKKMFHGGRHYIHKYSSNTWYPFSLSLVTSIPKTMVQNPFLILCLFVYPHLVPDSSTRCHSWGVPPAQVWCVQGGTHSVHGRPLTPPLPVDTQSKNITFPHTPCVGSNNGGSGRGGDLGGILGACPAQQPFFSQFHADFEKM